MKNLQTIHVWIKMKNYKCKFPKTCMRDPGEGDSIIFNFCSSNSWINSFFFYSYSPFFKWIYANHFFHEIPNHLNLEEIPKFPNQQTLKNSQITKHYTNPKLPNYKRSIIIDMEFELPSSQPTWAPPKPFPWIFFSFWNV